LSKKIKICHVSSVHLSFDTRIFYRYCKSLEKIYEVWLIACHPKSETISNINIKSYPRYKNRYFRVFFSWLLLLPKCISINAKIYHLHDPELIPLGLILKCFGKKIIYDIHENIAEDIFDKDWIKHKKLWYEIYNIFEKPAMKWFKIILAEDSYAKRYHNRAKDYSIIHNYCDINFFKNYEEMFSNRNPNNLFYIGVLFENRGILEICTAIYLLKQKGYIFNFHCVGELYNPLAEKMSKLPFFEDIRSQLIFYGRKNLEDGYAISKNCGIGLCIIHPMSNSIESYPTKLFEYMQIGLPFITSNFELYKKVAEENFCGKTVNPNDAEALSAAILMLYLDEEMRQKMANNGKQVVEKHYNWETEKQKTYSIYKNLLK